MPETITQAADPACGLEKLWPACAFKRGLPFGCRAIRAGARGHRPGRLRNAPARIFTIQSHKSILLNDTTRSLNIRKIKKPAKFTLTGPISMNSNRLYYLASPPKRIFKLKPYMRGGA